MALVKFRVRNFRSVEDSGWISCDSITTLVGVNEAGKSNLLLALWKLNPAKGGEINLLADIPRRIHAAARNSTRGRVFIEAVFSLSAEETKAIAEECLIENEEGLEVMVSRDFAGEVEVVFLNAKPTEYIYDPYFHKLLQQSYDAVHKAPSEPAKELALFTIAAIQAKISPPNSTTDDSNTDDSDTDDSDTDDSEDDSDTDDSDTDDSEDDSDTDDSEITAALLEDIEQEISKAPIDGPFKEHFRKIQAYIAKLQDYFLAPHKVGGVKELVLSTIPKFVYYSNYGNLDSEIYLPKAIEDMARPNLSGIAEAKARTLRVLFEFSGLKPQEILSMGQDPSGSNQEEIDSKAELKTERQALMHSAQTRLSQEFNEWWKQGRYSFDFRVDGNYFRIFVNDNRRSDLIELESRSTGLQWFLSFFLIFSVESKDAHANAILLLDEAGHSLHPIAQRDLVQFFENLSQTNQIIHSTHSPFLVNTNHIDRVRAVYLDQEGFTVASEDLKAPQGNNPQQQSLYAAHAALGLSVADILLQGCLPVIVEGVSDQIYLNTIKNWLIQNKAIAPSKEIIFAPSGGTSKITPLVGLLTSREGELIPVVLDSDQAGQEKRSTLAADLYKSAPEKLIAVGDFVDVPNAEIEDLIPFDVLDLLLARTLFHKSHDNFSEVYNPGLPLVGQLEAFASAQGITLEKSWKVALAKGFKQALLARPTNISDKYASWWEKLFAQITG